MQAENNTQLTPIVSRSKSKCYKAQKVQKYAVNSQLQALQILTNDDEVENWSLSSFLLAVNSANFCELFAMTTSLMMHMESVKYYHAH